MDAAPSPARAVRHERQRLRVLDLRPPELGVAEVEFVGDRDLFVHHLPQQLQRLRLAVVQRLFDHVQGAPRHGVPLQVGALAAQLLAHQWLLLRRRRRRWAVLCAARRGAGGAAAAAGAAGRAARHDRVERHVVAAFAAALRLIELALLKLLLLLFTLFALLVPLLRLFFSFLLAVARKRSLSTLLALATILTLAALLAALALLHRTKPQLLPRSTTAGKKHTHLGRSFSLLRSRLRGRRRRRGGGRQTAPEPALHKRRLQLRLPRQPLHLVVRRHLLPLAGRALLRFPARQKVKEQKRTRRVFARASSHRRCSNASPADAVLVLPSPARWKKRRRTRCVSSRRGGLATGSTRRRRARRAAVARNTAATHRCGRGAGQRVWRAPRGVRDHRLVRRLLRRACAAAARRFGPAAQPRPAAGGVGSQPGSSGRRRQPLEHLRSRAHAYNSNNTRYTV